MWFTQSADKKSVYVFVTQDNWKYGERKSFLLKSLKGNKSTKVSILGYDSQLVEYRKGYDASIYVDYSSLGLVISAVNGQRFYTNNKWDNPVVFKIENVEFNEIENITTTQDKIDGAL